MSYEIIKEKIEQAQGIIESLETINRNLEIFESDKEITFLSFYTDEDTASTESLAENLRSEMNNTMVDYFKNELQNMKNALEQELEEIMG